MPIVGSALKVSELPPAHSLCCNRCARSEVEEMPSWIEMETSLIPREKQEWRNVDGKFVECSTPAAAGMRHWPPRRLWLNLKPD